jgi:soluble lytic murein transglycosylase-like protein
MALGLAAAEAAVAKAPAVQTASPGQSVFEKEQAMTPAQLVQRWKMPVAKASRRSGVPVAWINAVMRVESGGRTMLSQNMRMVSDKGAVGIMQLMPQTYAQMRAQYRLGPDPFDPRDNIQAGAAYLRWLKSKYPYPAMFAAYNAGPDRVDGLLVKGTPLPEIRAAAPGEYAPGVQSVVSMGARLSQGVREDVATATAAIRIRGGRI